MPLSIKASSHQYELKWYDYKTQTIQESHSENILKFENWKTRSTTLTLERQMHTNEDYVAFPNRTELKMFDLAL